MRLINLFATDKSLTCDTRFAGMSGENHATQLVFRLDKTLMGNYKYFLRFCTSEQMSRGGMTVTGELNPTDGIILFSLPRTLTVAGILRVQLMVTDGSTTIFSPTLKGGLEIRRSIDGEAEGPDSFPTYAANGVPKDDDLISFYDIREYITKRATVGSFLKNFSTAESISLADEEQNYQSENIEDMAAEVATGLRGLNTSVSMLESHVNSSLNAQGASFTASINGLQEQITQNADRITLLEADITEGLNSVANSINGMV